METLRSETEMRHKIRDRDNHVQSGARDQREPKGYRDREMGTQRHIEMRDGQQARQRKRLRRTPDRWNPNP